MRKCRKCGKSKRSDQFYVNRRRADGLCIWCKTCADEYGRKWKKANPLAVVRYNFKQKGFEPPTNDELTALTDKQKGLCAICKQPETYTRNGHTYALAVDHNHKTGVVRGLLCQDCNRGLAKFHDDPVRLQAAIEYLSQ